jgi:hypothetical protein
MWVKPTAPSGSAYGYPVFNGAAAQARNCPQASACAIDFYSAQVAPPAPPTDTCFTPASPGGFYLDHWSTACDVATTTISTTSYSLVCFVYAGSSGSGTTTTYVNGASMSSASITPYSYPNPYVTFLIGANVDLITGEGFPTGSSTGNNFEGDIDEFTYWNVALSTAQVQGLYNNGAGCAAK